MMMTILSVFVFILVQGCAVCDEVYPISVLRGITGNQPEGFYDDDIERSYVPADPDIIWIDTNIVKKYGFVKFPDKDVWKTQPTFEGVLGTPEFKTTSDYVKGIFDRNPDWETTKTKFSRKENGNDICTDLLYITAARYLLVTQVLYEQSSNKLIPCAKTADGKQIVIPDSGVCFPAPYGSATCTSDYDVGLVGKNSGIVTERFNAYFQGVGGFDKPSELVFDTNVYAFTLEYAMPFYFDKLPVSFAENVVRNEQMYNFKMQELASAYFKVFKYNNGFFEALKTAAEGAMDPTTAPKAKTALNTWLGKFAAMNNVVKMRVEDFPSPARLRLSHNAEYQKRVKEMSEKGGYSADLLGKLAGALIYAAEAYHTRGAIRHVVGGQQMKVIDLSPRTPLSVNDLWVSMIENWGESNKEYNHCKEAPLVKCFLKMSKYMWRVFNAMRLVRARLPTEARLKGVVRFGEQFSDPEHAMSMWLAFKRRGKKEIPSDIEDVKSFLLQFGCDHAVLDIQAPIPPTCLSKMNDKINDYNKALASLVTDVSAWKGY
ncbi:uncharacterized protein LOC144646191 [Oculina patagonica]